ncbi:LysR family transcriptional regulator [Falsiruegeria mediterranea]|uniref:HTH-type transcriptional activator AmpR n=1 Tax=Falsiruegeria mediterranea M17 TaxID=1200281 RepID=A0A2R8CCZ7_9RHOB|nr:LysR family transcriptional regulator [Falsiruegeria mediterranea]SPJ30323.1 HTH-type transcriptional activator AmpR [Falsiruegeria mediterranea M17]
MQTQISLNAVRVFAITVRHMSVTNAAAELNVSPGAVSHQIKALEGALGVQLFLRSNNALSLTPDGARFANGIQPGLDLLDQSIHSATRGANELNLNVSLTLAMRWLVPRLERFKARHPRARIRIETHSGEVPPDSASADITICYCRGVPDEKADVLMLDCSQPLVSPTLLDRLGSDLSSIPALQCAKDNWDWHEWQAAAGLADQQLSFDARFDLDDAAVRAAVAGMGMVLSPLFMVQDDINSGRLVPLPGVPAVPLGHYGIQLGPRDTGLRNQFCDWLGREAGKA